ncbi:DUF3223 domain-containing protein [Thiothrix sp.]|jgi:hypothetical protein|uniref:DUF3223 domain-containing protein n=1 Tax=Thiothrix sp. TaxID=1032 RepID=UPI00257E52E1|nr:DUF3223 domain-containing protein [Thiothrix sp.]
MPYIIAEESFATKNALEERCRMILKETPDGHSVSEEASDFLFGLFQYHDEWLQKFNGGVLDITTQTTPHGTRCFALRKHDGRQIDISFPHAIRLIPSTRSVNLLPQALRDFKNAARTAIQGQIFAFRDKNLIGFLTCPITGEPISRRNVVVDHIPPNTFDQLLFNFCVVQSIDPLKIVVGSEGGTIAVFKDLTLLSDWQAYHEYHAQLRLLSKLGNLQLPKLLVGWNQIYNAVS